MDIKLEKIDDYRWLIPKAGNMRVPGLVFSNHKLIEETQRDQSLVQVANVATLPGIVIGPAWPATIRPCESTI